MDCSVFVLLAAILIALESMAEVEEPREFKADHPFVYAIRDKGVNTILFVGRVKKFVYASYFEPLPVKVFKADRPFGYSIRHHATNTIVFLGVVHKLMK
ncbi:hypothetical protein M8J76_010781 [Diaphorina citri]|nr:hypothetical protein M8J76_010781 [Diaphorina citri]